ncbi:hypothetical protein CAC01_17060 [Streptomyces sp. CLI2509]|nr:hypothetical protein CAC01_17060 [Streptomyces sp. CLI2509]MYX22735.1 hypothetical protein [Streptomyces sp. SID8380]
MPRTARPQRARTTGRLSGHRLRRGPAGPRRRAVSKDTAAFFAGLDARRATRTPPWHTTCWPAILPGTPAAEPETAPTETATETGDTRAARARKRRRIV